VETDRVAHTLANVREIVPDTQYDDEGLGLTVTTVGVTVTHPLDDVDFVAATVRIVFDTVPQTLVDTDRVTHTLAKVRETLPDLH
jgi:hypothetical protein